MSFGPTAQRSPALARLRPSNSAMVFVAMGKIRWMVMWMELWKQRYNIRRTRATCLSKWHIKQTRRYRSRRFPDGSPYCANSTTKRPPQCGKEEASQQMIEHELVGQCYWFPMGFLCHSSTLVGNALDDQIRLLRRGFPAIHERNIR